MKVLKFLIGHFEEILAAPLMVVMSLMVTIQVLCRFVFHLNTPWAEEFLRYCFIWNIMLGSSIAIKLKAHIGVSLLVEYLPRLPRMLTETLALITVIFICGLFFQASWSVMVLQKGSGQIMPALGVPIFTSTLALPVGFTLIALRSLVQLLDNWKRFLNRPTKKEV
ncbi:MAG: TRAP transporter small permease [Candidatus Adiutrix sp.]|jgi:TRAP-type C4-dicarboxylate transport system permease small subunit|nr:TRAP transporter small permease [Candidatus Adiutrix sp.]